MYQKAHPETPTTHATNILSQKDFLDHHKKGAPESAPFFHQQPYFNY